MGFTLVFVILWQTMMQYCCSRRSVIFAEIYILTCPCHTSLSIADCQGPTLSWGGGGKYSRMNMNITDTFAPKDCYLASLLYAVKFVVRDFLNRRHTELPCCRRFRALTTPQQCTFSNNIESSKSTKNNILVAWNP